MKSFVFLAGLLGLASAQYTTQSGPFELVVLSSNSTLNGTTLAACHEGAAIESLCPAGSLTPGLPSTTYYFNTSSTSSSDPLGDQGLLVWYLSATGANDTIMRVPEALTLSESPSSDAAVPIFYPSATSSQTFVFDSNDMLAIRSAVDDTTDPATIGAKNLYNWYVCTTYYSYVYTTLAWAEGQDGAKPENPTCQKVSVKRISVGAPGYKRVRSLRV